MVLLPKKLSNNINIGTNNKILCTNIAKTCKFCIVSLLVLEYVF